MNYHALTHDEASYLLFSFKKTLRDRTGLTPQMEQFYESGIRILREKLERFDKAGEGRIEPPKRYRYTEVRPTWRDVPLTGEPSHSPRNNE